MTAHTEGKPTPGPWVADLSTTNGHLGFAIRSGEVPIATVYADAVSSEWRRVDAAQRPENSESVANAHMLAASKKMAEAVEAAIERMRAEGLDATAEYNGLWAALAKARNRDEIKMRRAALAAAEGRTDAAEESSHG